jgi:hypothetical protein
MRVLDPSKANYAMKTKLTMRPFVTYASPDDIKGMVFHHVVVDGHGQVVAWISHCARDTTWQIQRFKDGFPGDGTGEYETAEAALAVLQKDFD